MLHLCFKGSIACYCSIPHDKVVAMPYFAGPPLRKRGAKEQFGKERWAQLTLDLPCSFFYYRWKSPDFSL